MPDRADGLLPGGAGSRGYLGSSAENFDFDPFDMPAAHLFKIGAGGLVHEIEAVGFTAPYESPTGWE